VTFLQLSRTQKFTKRNWPKALQGIEPGSKGNQFRYQCRDPGEDCASPCPLDRFPA